jgi:hypothetical protein
MDVDKFPFGLGSSGSNKRSFVEALKEFTSQQTTSAKRISVDPIATDTVRVEVNKVFP